MIKLDITDPEAAAAVALALRPRPIALRIGCGSLIIAAAMSCGAEPDEGEELDALARRVAAPTVSRSDHDFDACEREAYQPCDADPSQCAWLGPNTNCASYTKDPDTSFCAPYCTRDESCPT